MKIRTVLCGTISRKAQFGYGVVWKLNPTVAGKKHAVINHWTKNAHKVYDWKEGETFSVEVLYKVGPDALMIEEIL